jgi:hypothetical protein
VGIQEKELRDSSARQSRLREDHNYFREEIKDGWSELKR